MSDSLNLHNDSPLRRLLYLGAILLVGVPLLQAGSQLWPLQLGNIQWRFAVANALSSVLLLPFIGLLTLFAVSRAIDSRGVSRMVGGIAAFLSIGIVGSLVVFYFDASELRAIVNSQQLATFTSTTLKVEVISALFSLAFAVLALAGFSAPQNAVAGRKSEKEESIGLIVGR